MSSEKVIFLPSFH